MFPWDLQTSNDFNLARGQAEHASFGSCLDLAGIMRTHVSKFDYLFLSQQICKPSDYSLCSDWCENMERMHGTRYSKCISKHSATTKSWRILKDYVDRLSQNHSIKLLRVDHCFSGIIDWGFAARCQAEDWMDQGAELHNHEQVGCIPKNQQL